MYVSHRMAAASPPLSIFPLGISCGPSYWKTHKEGNRGSVVSCQANTLPKPPHPAFLSKLGPGWKDSSGGLSWRTPSYLLRKCTGLVQSWETTFKREVTASPGYVVSLLYDLHRQAAKAPSSWTLCWPGCGERAFSGKSLMGFESTGLSRIGTGHFCNDERGTKTLTSDTNGFTDRPHGLLKHLGWPWTVVLATGTVYPWCWHLGHQSNRRNPTEIRQEKWGASKLVAWEKQMALSCQNCGVLRGVPQEPVTIPRPSFNHGPKGVI